MYLTKNILMKVAFIKTNLIYIKTFFFQKFFPILIITLIFFLKEIIFLKEFFKIRYWKDIVNNHTIFFIIKLIIQNIYLLNIQIVSICIQIANIYNKIVYVNCNFLLIKEIKIYNIWKCLYLIFIDRFFVKKYII